MVVYRITNRINGKTYIGKTIVSVEKRWKEHVWDAAHRLDLYLHRSIRVHGAESFSIEILYQAKTLRELNAMETFFIILHQSHRAEHGYNMTLGGEGGAQILPSVRARMSQPGARNPRFGKKWSTEVKARISGTQKDRIFTEAHRAALKAAWARRKAATV